MRHIILFLFLLLSIPGTAAAELVVIVNLDCGAELILRYRLGLSATSQDGATGFVIAQVHPGDPAPGLRRPH